MDNDVTKAFYEALAYQATVVVLQRLLGLALNAVETVHQLANVGQVVNRTYFKRRLVALRRLKIDLCLLPLGTPFP